MKKVLLIILAVMLICGVAYADEGCGRKVVTAAGTAEALGTNQSVDVITICAETDNTGVIAVGNSDVVATVLTRKGIPLNAGDCYTEYKKSNNLLKIYIDSTVNGDGVTYDWQSN